MSSAPLFFIKSNHYSFFSVNITCNIFYCPLHFTFSFYCYEVDLFDCERTMVLKASALGRLGDAWASKRLPSALKKGPL
jgi:hypothetical protein